MFLFGGPRAGGPRVRAQSAPWLIRHSRTLMVHIGTNNTQRRNNDDSEEIQESTEEDEWKRGLDRLSYQGFYQYLEPGAKDTEIRVGWQSTGL